MRGDSFTSRRFSADAAVSRLSQLTQLHTQLLQPLILSTASSSPHDASNRDGGGGEITAVRISLQKDREKGGEIPSENISPRQDRDEGEGDEITAKRMSPWKMEWEVGVEGRGGGDSIGGGECGEEERNAGLDACLVCFSCVRFMCERVCEYVCVKARGCVSVSVV